MASIKIAELRPAGSELFQDSESFLNELNEKEISTAIGGGSVVSVISQATASIGISILTASVVSQKTFNF
ncbi:hypothetical protein BV378_02950 [Nostoc sp. RF31YmG]|nr:hypothetical protein BV378_02950 [Nostoc sp. RF31YmG]